MKKDSTSVSVFKHRNSDLVRIFRQAGHPQKVMLVALDYAKQTHTALICDGEGRSLKSVFDVTNDPAGMAALLAAVRLLCKKQAIEEAHVCFGGEDCGSFTCNFIYALNAAGFLVVSVNAQNAKNQRENFQASTDKLDLLGILKMLQDKRGNTHVAAVAGGKTLRSLTRHRAGLVETKTAVSNRIHDLVDQLFPGFLDETKSGIPPFSEASLGLMSDRFSPIQLKGRNRKTLIHQLQKHGLRQAEEKAAQLQLYGDAVLSAAPDMVGPLQTSLRHEVQLYTTLADCIEQTAREMASLLAKEPGAWLTTIKGTGVVLAAGVSAELGHNALATATRRLSSYAGIVPRTEQTGGPSSPAKQRSVSRRCNHRLKNVLVQCGNHMGQHGPEDLKEDHRRRVAQGQHADFGMARRYLRIGLRLMRNCECYQPEALRRTRDHDAARTYYLEIWPTLRDKWQKAGALEIAFHRDNPLGQWRECVQNLYQICLPLK